MSHIARCCLFRSGGLCQYGLLAIWPESSVVGSKCEQQVEQLHQQLKERILVLDGGMGTMIQWLSSE